MPAQFRRLTGRSYRCCLAGGVAWLLAAGSAASQTPQPDPRPAQPGFAPAEVFPYFVRLGAGVVDYRTSGSASTRGNAIDNARVAFNSHAVATAEAGWRFSPLWSMSLLAGIPPTVSLQGEGALERLGVLRKVTYGSVIAGLQFHPFGQGWIDPYVGGGLDYTFVFRTRGGSLPDLRIADSFGPVLQAGVDLRLTERLSLYLDARKIWLSFDGKGMAPTSHGLAPVRVEVQPNPVVTTVGLSFRF
jgi:outer membrane protein